MRWYFGSDRLSTPFQKFAEVSKHRLLTRSDRSRDRQSGSFEIPDGIGISHKPEPSEASTLPAQAGTRRPSWRSPRRGARTRAAHNRLNALRFVDRAKQRLVGCLFASLYQ